MNLDLDDKTQRALEHSLHNAYGLEVTNGTPHDRLNAVYEIAGQENCLVFTAGSDFTTMNDLATAIVAHFRSNIPENADITRTDASIELENFSDTLVIHNFDTLEQNEQTSIAQWFKGLVEGRFEGGIAYTTTQTGSVVAAEPDLRGRIRTFSVTKH